jgi:hypothetical protein
MWEEIVKTPIPETSVCSCGELATRILTTFGHYKIKGSNNASTTPKRYRSED